MLRKYHVKNKQVSCFSSAEGIFPVVGSIVELPEGSVIEAQLLMNGVIDEDAGFSDPKVPAAEAFPVTPAKPHAKRHTK